MTVHNCSSGGAGAVDGGDSSNLWYVGVIIYTLGTVCMALGVNLQKFSLNRDLKSENPRSPVKQPLWLLGISLYVGSGMMLTTALGFGSPALLTPLYTLVLVNNALLARVFLGEKLSKQDAGSLSLVIAGTTVALAFAPHTDDTLSAEELFDLYGDTGFILYAVFCVLFAAAMYALYIPLKREWDATGKANPSQFKYKRLFPFAYAGLAGFYGGVCVFLLKSVITIIVDMFSGGTALQRPMTYFLIALMAFTWTQEMRWINAGLVLFQAVYIVSVETILNVLFAVIGAMIFFKDYECMSAGELIGFIGGVAVANIGVFILSTKVRDLFLPDDEEDVSVVGEAQRAMSVASASTDASASSLRRRTLSVVQFATRNKALSMAGPFVTRDGQEILRKSDALAMTEL